MTCKSASASASASSFAFYIIDTRKLWPGDDIRDAASTALDLLDDETERRGVTSKVYARDARMALASALVKRYFVAMALERGHETETEAEAGTEAGTGTEKRKNVENDADVVSSGGDGGVTSSRKKQGTWNSIRFERKGDAKHGKPVVEEACLRELANPPTTTREGKQVAPEQDQEREQCPYVDFNVSHQAGLVVLVGTTARGVEVGVDVTCVDERDDMGSIKKKKEKSGVGGQDGFGAWVDVFEQVLSSREVAGLKEWIGGDEITIGSGSGSAASSAACDSEALLRMKLRRFYTLWAYKEAYLKMTGDALLADWVKDLEFDNLRAPRPVSAGVGGNKGLSLGEKVTDVVPKLARERISDTSMEIQAFEDDYLIATAIRSEGARFRVDDIKYTFLKIEDIIAFATHQRKESN